jgi:SAM-dependent methyltransferase
MKKPEDPAVLGVPSTYDFVFDYNEALGLITQRCDPALLKMLDRIYSMDANVGYLQIGSDLANDYGADLLRFLQESFVKAGTPANVLEIGCGGCWVLDALSRQGLNVQGIDPSPVAVRVAREHGLHVHHGLFPAVKGDGSVDFIFHSDVLEHIQDPVKFLNDHRLALTEAGHIVIAVPDCSDPIVNGDISMVIHQHINYFDEISLRRTVEAAGYSVLCIEKSKFGGSLYCLASARKDDAAGQASADRDRSYFQSFLNSAHVSIKAVDSYIEEVASKASNSLGCYVPLRAIPYLAAVGRMSGIRLFDDAAHMHGATIDGNATPFENFADLVAEPVTDMLIVSFSFGDKIKSKIRNRFGDSMRVWTIVDLLQQDSSNPSIQ